MGKPNLLLVGQALIFITFVRLFGSLYCCGVGRSFQINITILALDFLHVLLAWYNLICETVKVKSFFVD